MHEAGDYFYRFIDQLSQPEFNTLRSRLKGVDLGYHAADQSAESVDKGSDENQESAAKDPYIKFVADMRGIDPADPWALTKANPQRALRKVDTEGLSQAEVDALNRLKSSPAGYTGYASQLESDYKTALYDRFMGTDLADQALNKYRYMATGKSPVKGGVGYTHHLDNLMALMARAESTLDVGIYQLEHPTVVAALVDMSKKISTAVHVNNPFGLGVAADFGADYLRSKIDPSSEFTMSKVTSWDHFKFYGIDLHGGDNASFMMGSANATVAAMGRIGSGRGSNLENMFVLTPEMAGKEVSVELYKSLINQAISATEWIRSNEIYGRDFQMGMSSGERTISRLMGTGDTASAHRDLINRAVAERGHIQIMNFEIGDTFARDLERVIRAGGSVDILTGVDHADSDGPSATKLALDGLKSRLGGLPGLNIVKSQQFVHTKTTVYNYGSEQVFVMGSTNLTGGMLRGYHEAGSFGRNPNLGRLYTRDLDLLLTSLEAGVLVAGEAKKVSDIIYGAGLYKRASHIAGGGSHVSDLLSALSSRTAFAGSDMVSVKNLIDHSTGEAYGADVNIGGQYLDSVFARNLLKFRVVNLEGSRGAPGQLYIPELGKIIGPTRGVVTSGEARDYTAYETVAAGISYLNNSISDMFEGSGLTQEDMSSAYMRGRVKSLVRAKFREAFANFEGLEKGKLVYNARHFARLGFMAYAGQLDLSPNRIDASIVEASTSNQYLASLADGDATPRYNLGGNGLIFRSGGLSRRRGPAGASSAARLFDLPGLADSLPISSKLAEDDYFFMLPTGKLVQMPQRIGNIMSARSLTYKGSNAKSLLGSPDGNVHEGIRLSGYMALGMGSDIAYFDSSKLSSSKFGVDYLKTIKVPTGHIDPTSLGTLRDFLWNNAENLGGNKFKISTSQLTAMGHEIPLLGLITEGIHNKITQNLALPTNKWTGSDPEMILDLNKLSLETRDNMTHITLQGEVLRSLQSGDRIMLGIKTPLVFIEGNSNLFTRLGDLAKKIDPKLYGAFGLANANIVFGSNTIKTGDALIQTGLELIKAGLTNDLLSKTDLLRQTLHGPRSTSKYSELFDRFAPYIDDVSMTAIRKLSLEAGADALRDVFSDTQRALGKGSVSLARGQVKHIAAAYLAFGLHALNFWEQTRTNNMGFGEGFINAFVPVYAVSSVSSSAVSMSSRERVNFLNYHAGQYTDAFMDMMAMDPRVQSRALAYRELLSSSMLHGGTTGEIIIGGLDSTPMSKYKSSMHDVFSEVTAITRLLEGRGLGQDKFGLASMSHGQLQSRLTYLDSRIQATSTVVTGGYQSKYIHSFLEAEKSAGVGARTLLVPELGRWDRNASKFIFDDDSRTASFREVKLMSPEALLGLGSFEDYSHDVQRLQVQILQELPLINEIFAGGRVPGVLTTDQRSSYTRFRELIGELEEAQMTLAASGFQKILGGQLSIPGQNMIALTHHELPKGYMVVGSEAFSAMKSQAVTEMKQSLRKAYGDNRQAMIAELVTLAESHGLEASPRDVRTAIKSRMAKWSKLQSTINENAYRNPVGYQITDNSFTLFNADGTHVASWKGAWVPANLMGTRRPSTKWEASDTLQYDIDEIKEVRQAAARDNSLIATLRSAADDIALELAELTGSDDDSRYKVKQLEAEHKAIRGQIKDLTGIGRAIRSLKKHYIYDPIQEQRQLKTEIRALQVLQRERTLSVDEILNRLIDSPLTRDLYLKGVYQRAGAPMGPLGIVPSKVITVQEFNRFMAVDARLSEDHFRRSFMMSMGGMMFNLGDFDGDTASVARLGVYTGMKLLDMLGKLGVASPDERGVYGAVDREMSRHVDERFISFAEHYLGGSPIFTKSVYKSTRAELADMSTGKARKYFAALERLDSKGALTQANLIADLANFRTRRDSAYNLAVGAVTFSKDILGNIADADKYVSNNLSRFGGDRVAALTEYMRSEAGVDSAKELAKVTSTLVDHNLGIMDSKITKNEILSISTMVSWAATFLIGKVYETTFAIQTYFGAERGLMQTEIARELRSLGYEGTNARTVVYNAQADNNRSQHVRSLLGEFDAVNQNFSKIQGIVLLAQQMARDAIKPKLEGQTLARLRQFAGNDPDYVASGINLGKSFVRTKALEALNILVEGRNYDSSMDKDGKRFASAQNISRETALQLHGEILSGFNDYFQGSIEGLMTYGATTGEFLDGLLEVDETGKSLMTKSELKRALSHAYSGDQVEARLAAAENLFDADGNINLEAARSMDLSVAKDIVQAHMFHRAEDIATTAVLEFNTADVMNYRQDYLKYASAVNGATSPDDFLSKIDTIDSITKLKVFAGMTARGTVGNSHNMALALQDIFMDYSDSESMRYAAEMASDSNAFADNMEKLHQSYTQRGTLDIPSGAGAVKIDNLRSKMNLINEMESLDGSKDPERLAELREELKDVNIETTKQEHERWTSMEKIQSALGVSRFELNPASRALETITERFNNWTKTHVGQNLAGTLVASGVFAALGASAGSSSEAFATTAVMGASMLSPGGMGSAVMSTDKENRNVRMGITMLSIGAGILAGEASSKIAHGIAGPRLNNLGSVTAAGIGATVVGFGVGQLLEFIAKKTGLLNHFNPIPAHIGAVIGAFDDLADQAESVFEELYGETTQVIWEATGEVLAIYSSDDGDGDNSGIQPDLDTAITSYDEATS